MFILAVPKNGCSKGEEDDETDRHGVREPTACEVCRILAFELNEQLLKTNKKETILIGHALDGDSGKRAKKIDYQRFAATSKNIKFTQNIREELCAIEST